MENIVYGMDYHDYRSAGYLAKSDLDLININPSLYEWKRTAPIVKSKKKSLEFGTLFHKCVLEPVEFQKEFMEVLNFKDIETSLELLDLWGVEVEEGSTAEQIQNKFEKAVSKGACGYTHEDIEKCCIMNQSLQAHPYFEELFYTGEAEVSYFLDDFASSLGVKCRADFVNDDNNTIIDLKTTSRPAELAKSIIQYRYDVQAAYYKDIIKAITGVDYRFIFCFVSTAVLYDSYPVYFVELTDAQLHEAREKYKANLEEYREYTQGGNISFININVKKWW